MSLQLDIPTIEAMTPATHQLQSKLVDLAGVDGALCSQVDDEFFVQAWGCIHAFTQVAELAAFHQPPGTRLRLTFSEV